MEQSLWTEARWAGTVNLRKQRAQCSSARFDAMLQAKEQNLAVSDLSLRPRKESPQWLHWNSRGPLRARQWSEQYMAFFSTDALAMKRPPQMMHVFSTVASLEQAGEQKRALPARQGLTENGFLQWIQFFSTDIRHS
jgi:hypothetical protein